MKNPIEKSRSYEILEICIEDTGLGIPKEM